MKDDPAEVGDFYPFLGIDKGAYWSAPIWSATEFASCKGSGDPNHGANFTGGVPR